MGWYGVWIVVELCVGLATENRWRTTMDTTTTTTTNPTNERNIIRVHEPDLSGEYFK